MNGSKPALETFLKDVCPALQNDVDSGIAVPYTLIDSLKKGAEGRDFKVAAQNMHYEDKGAFTGELSADMIVEAGANTVIIGHSERRTYYNETDESVNLKLKTALAKGLLPIVCCGETLDEREAGKQEDICESQVKNALSGIPAEQVKGVVLAYEPIWAIGTGKTASSQDAEAMAKHIRGVVASLYCEETAQSVRIQYGGSVKPGNVKEIMSMPNIDGALVGGASLKAEDFIKLIQFKAD